MKEQINTENTSSLLNNITPTRFNCIRNALNYIDKGNFKEAYLEIIKAYDYITCGCPWFGLGSKLSYTYKYFIPSEVLIKEYTMYELEKFQKKLRLPEFKITKVYEYLTRFEIECERSDECFANLECGCNLNTLHISAFKNNRKLVWDLDILGKKTYLNIPNRSYSCPNCSYFIYNDKYNSLSSGNQITFRQTEYLLNQNTIIQYKDFNCSIDKLNFIQAINFFQGGDYQIALKCIENFISENIDKEIGY